MLLLKRLNSGFTSGLLDSAVILRSLLASGHVLLVVFPAVVFWEGKTG